MKSEPRIVIDANVLVSAALLPFSAPRRAVGLATQIGWILFSEPLTRLANTSTASWALVTVVLNLDQLVTSEQISPEEQYKQEKDHDDINPDDQNVPI